MEIDAELPEAVEVELEADITSPLYVNFDVNAYLEDHSEGELFALLGKLKDLLSFR